MILWALLRPRRPFGLRHHPREAPPAFLGGAGRRRAGVVRREKQNALMHLPVGPSGLGTSVGFNPLGGPTPVD